MTKKILVGSVIALFTSINLKSQNNDVEITAKWNISYYDGGSDNCLIKDDYLLYFNGDTIINGSKYFKLFQNGHYYKTIKMPNIPCSASGYYYNNFRGLVRYYQKKLLLRQNNQDNIVIDYNLLVGDTIKNNYFANGSKFKVDSINTIIISGNTLKRFYYKNPNQPQTAQYIIEKIGSFHGFIEQGNLGFESDYTLLCYSENNISLFPNNAQGCNYSVNINENNLMRYGVLIFPNPTSNFIQLKVENESNNINSLKISNVLGETVLESKNFESHHKYDLAILSKGIYFLTLSFDNGTVITKKIIKN